MYGLKYEGVKIEMVVIAEGFEKVGFAGRNGYEWMAV